MTAHQISLSTSPMGRSIDRFAAMRQWDRVYDRDSYPLAHRVSNFIQIFIAVERRLVRIKPLQSNSSRNPVEDLFKIAHGATLAAENP